MRPARAAVASLLLLGCQPTHGFRFTNPSPTRYTVYLLEARAPDSLAVEGNAACAAMRPVRTPLGTVDTVQVMPDSTLTLMIAFGSDFSTEARYCLVSTVQGRRRADTLYLRGDTALAHASGGVVTLQLHPVLELVRRR